MKKAALKMMPFVLMLCMTVILFASEGYATETEDPVMAVTAQLEAIDTLQQIQDKRSNYTVKNNYYDSGTTDAAIKEEHLSVRAQYEEYVAKMFAARMAAQQAYDALSADQQAQIDSSLVAKLSNHLPTVFHKATYAVTPADNEYTFEAVNGGKGYAYEVSTHMVSGNIPQTFILVDTSDGKNTWTPNGRYAYGQSNYEVVYCSDVETRLTYSANYKRINLEDSSYYGASAASHIRAILQNSYPYLTMDEMKASLKAGGLSSAFVDSLTRADMIAATQMAVWSYANAEDGAKEGLGYFASINISKNNGSYFTALHDYTNECWEWQPGKGQRSFDSRAQYRVNRLAYYLCMLPGVKAPENAIVISDVEVTRAELLPGEDDTYEVGLYIYFNGKVDAQDDLKVAVYSGIDRNGPQVLNGRQKVGMTVKAKVGDTIRVVIEGVQHVEKGVYFYEPEGGRTKSQCLVGVGEGKTSVRAEKKFVFGEDVSEMGLRIYKTENGTGLPLSEITFTIYSTDGEISDKPTAEEIAKYQTDENKVISITTDETGYASAELTERGVYLIVEEHNADKIKSPVEPFYVSVPMSMEEGMIHIVSVYPKNETVPLPEPPPIIPPVPDNVTGRFEIVKYDQNDTSKMLEGARFEVYRMKTSGDMVPVTIGGEPLVLVTDKNGKAGSPELEAGAYVLVEIQAPAGYDLLKEPVAVTVVQSEVAEVTTVRIANQRGAILPETGGIGAHWFWLTGAVLIVGAAFQLAARKRSHS